MKPSLYERKTRGGVSYRAYAQMLSQTILGTECSLFHFQKTSDLLWQRQIGKRQKKERKKEGIKKKSPMQTVMPYWSGNDTSSADFILFLRRKTCSVKAHTSSSHWGHRRSESFLAVMPDVLSAAQRSHSTLFSVSSIMNCLYGDSADGLITRHFKRRKRQHSQFFSSVCVHLPCSWIKDSPCNIWNVMFLTTDSGNNLFLQKWRPTHDDSIWPK